ncbi:unnamed protein product [Blepharisma stoltei]|uniref:GDT1 family protein n=1 Tax=Blepharisma stoltei TaxID=1481888 RepID=A0AAU9IDJ9_9CILI|nr:unnamed protein product [Blepharisma stoltei]
MTDTRAIISTGSPLETIGSSLLTIFIAEIGDRTFFIIAVLAMTYSRSAIFLGNQLTMTFIAVIAAFIGGAVIYLIDPFWVAIASSVMFLVYAILSFYEAYAGESEKIEGDNQEPLISYPTWFKTFWKTAAMVFFAEWGDKSNTSIMALAALSNPIFVAIGAIMGFAIIGFLAVILGKVIGKHIPEKIVKIAAGALYLVFAALTLALLFI